MGADLAASPHCPFASDLAWKARPFAPGDFEWRKPRQAPAPLPPESERSRSSIRFPRGLPVRAEALAVRRLADSGPKPWRFAAWQIRDRSPSSRPWRFHEPKPVKPLPAGSLAEALVPPGRSMNRSSGFPPLRSPRAEARSCPTDRKPKLLFPRWQRADRSPASAWAGPEPKSGVPPFRFLKPEGLWFRVGALRSVPLQH